MSFRKFFIYTSLLSLVLPTLALAENMSSSNYNLENSSFNVGGEQSNSSNYISTDSVGDANDSSSSSANYKVYPGTLQPIYPAVPAAPTLTNTGGNLYNSLDFVVSTGGNPTDVQYAIAISSNDFVTTYFIQTDDTLSTAPAWQTYVQWGSSSGERVTGLSPNITYKIKVKARYEADTETGYSVTVQSATVNPSISVSFTGIGSGQSVEGQTTGFATTATTVPFGSLVIDTVKVGSQTITVSTNATSGYTTTIYQDNNLKQAQNFEIDPVSGTNASPAAFPGSITRGAFGYHTSDDVLCTGTTSRFTADNTYASVTSTASEVACNTSSVAGEATFIVYKLLIGSQQENGLYTNNITFITTGTF